MPKRRRYNHSRSSQPGKKSKSNDNSNAQTVDESINAVAAGLASDNSFVSSNLDAGNPHESEMKLLLDDIIALRDIVKQQQETITVLSAQFDFLVSFFDIPKDLASQGLANAMTPPGSSGIVRTDQNTITDWPALPVHDNTTRSRQPWPSITSTFRQTVAAVVQSEQRSVKYKAKNFIVSGLPVSDTVSDKDLITEICRRDIGIIPCVKKCRRLGELPTNQEKIQKLLVITDDQMQVNEIIANAKLLRRSADLLVRKQVYINADLTKAESRAAFERRQRRRDALRSGTWYPTSAHITGGHALHVPASRASSFDLDIEARSNIRSGDGRIAGGRSPSINPSSSAIPALSVQASAFVPRSASSSTSAVTGGVGDAILGAVPAPARTGLPETVFACGSTAAAAAAATAGLSTGLSRHDTDDITDNIVTGCADNEGAVAPTTSITPSGSCYNF